VINEVLMMSVARWASIIDAASIRALRALRLIVPGERMGRRKLMMRETQEIYRRILRLRRRDLVSRLPAMIPPSKLDRPVRPTSGSLHLSTNSRPARNYREDAVLGFCAELHSEINNRSR